MPRLRITHQCPDCTTIKKIPLDAIPMGWSDGPQLLEEHFKPYTCEFCLVQRHGLQNFTPVLFNRDKWNNADVDFIITSGGRYYIGELSYHAILEITWPRTLADILLVLGTRGESGLRRREIVVAKRFRSYWERT
ncbi:uncharacterized protein KD926_004375 [Aspergillus affinis]|uniref:uncharacterized protein n=1 Tax=Aspergillus affinis TaxID=1070780 RepID=UPI0022FEAE61|nr:uncharacterized protein KD926_004375 [Aspergillus affinis]KAI9043192.1 hypothetical protein KD926_004375 [Aspergillus affinis]